MLDDRTQLFVFHDDDSTFEDLSQSMQDYGRNEEVVDLVAADDFLYVGFVKPINALFVEMNTVNTVTNTFDARFFNGTTFVALTEFLDDTRGFTRSGFISWKRDQIDEAKTTIDGQEAFWYRFKASANHDVGTKVQGLNIVFADDEDIKAEVFEIVGTKFLPSGTTSHILTHVSARDEIVQLIRNHKNTKFSQVNFKLLDMTAFDFLDFFQIRNAATYLAISKIYWNISDQPDDNWSIKGERWRKRFKEAVNVFLLDLDRDNDGLKDNSDQTFQTRVGMARR